MVLDHERLDVYAIALDFLVFANELIESLPRGRSHLADQLTRASTSIVLNLAEGAGKLSKADKRRYYLTARGSATESAALLDVCLRLKLVGEAEHRAGKAMVVRVVSMLIKLAMSFEDARPGTVGQLLCAAAVRRDDGHAVLRGQRGSKRIRVVGLVAEQTRGQHSGDELLGGSIVVPLALGDLEREGQSERVDHYVDLRGEAAARATNALLCGLPFHPRRADERG